MNLQPSVPGYTHGIISLDPPTVQCDGCGYTYSNKSFTVAVLASGIQFNPKTREDPRRLCVDCARQAGWTVGR